MMRGKIWLITALILVVAAGCKTRRNGREGKVQRGMDKEQLLAKNQKAAVDFKFLSVKGKASLENIRDDKSLDFSYKANIAKDSLVWATITKFGLPLAQILADPDTIRIRRLDTKEVNICDYSILTKAAGMDIDFELLQNLFTGEPPESAAEFAFSEVKNPGYQLSGKQSHFDVDLYFDASNFKLVQMNVEDAALGMESTLTYGEFLEVESQLVPSKVLLHVKSPAETKVTMEHSRIDIDDNADASFTFRIPKSYDITDCKL